LTVCNLNGVLTPDAAVPREWTVLDRAPDRDRICARARVCVPGQEWMRAPPTEFVDTDCVPLTVCDARTQYISTPAVLTADRVCAAATVCTAGQWEQAPLRPSHDRVCAYHKACVALAQALDGEYEASPPTSYSDRVCRPLSRCAAGSQWELAPPTATSDRCCANATRCAAVGVEWEASPLSTRADRRCANVTACSFPALFVRVPPTATADALCAPVTACADVGEQWERRSPTPSSDRDCVAVTLCDVGRNELEFVSPQRTSDRVCAVAPVAEGGSAIANLSLRMDYAEVAVSASAATSFADALLSELARLLAVARSRLSVTRLLKGSVIVEFLVNPAEDDGLPPVDAVRRLQAMHANRGSDLYKSTLFPLLSRVDPNVPITFDAQKEGLGFGVLLALGAGIGGPLALLSGCLLLQALRLLRPAKYAPGAAVSALEPVPPQGAWLLATLASSALSCAMQLAFAVLCAGAEREFTLSWPQYRPLYVLALLHTLALTPLGTAAALALLACQKRTLEARARKLAGGAHGAELLQGGQEALTVRTLLLGAMSVLAPAWVVLLPWHPSQRSVVAVAATLLALLSELPALLLQLDFAARKGGFEQSTQSTAGVTQGRVLAVALGATTLSLLVRVGLGVGADIWAAYAGRIRAVRRKLTGAVDKYRLRVISMATGINELTEILPGCLRTGVINTGAGGDNGTGKIRKRR
jgi:hypothetical protein